MNPTEIIQRVNEYKEKGFDPDNVPSNACLVCGGVDCPICEEHKSGWCYLISNKKKQSIDICDECFKLFLPKIKKILITSGGTREYIDGVRVLTNISSGKLGATIADKLIKDTKSKNGYPGCHIHFVYVKGSVKPWNVETWKGLQSLTLHEVTDVQSVYNVMEKLVPEIDVVIHPMAVSDFGFKPINTKLKSNDPMAFIESLKKRIYQTPKILSHIKQWNPNCFLISFKFENGLTKKKLLEIAFESMFKNDSDLVIANDKKEMVRTNSHVSYFCRKPNQNDINFEKLKPFVKKVISKEKIAEEIFKIVNSI